MKKRIKILGRLAVVLFLVLGVAMYMLQIYNGASYAAQAETAKVRRLTTRGARGRILDRYGRVIATNKGAYEVVLNLSEINRDDLNAAILGALQAMRAGGVECSHSLPIQSTEQGLVFSSATAGSAFFAQHGIEPAGAEQALAQLRKYYSIPAGMDDGSALRVVALYVAANSHQPAYSRLDSKQYSAIVELSKSIGQPFEFDSAKRSVWPIADVARLSPEALLLISNRCEQAAGSAPALSSVPLTIAEATMWNTDEIRRMKQDAGIDPAATAEQCIYHLVEKYDAGDIPAEYLMDLLAIRLESTRTGYRAYNPLTIGIGTDGSIAAVVHESALSLQGVSVEQSSIRWYPNGEVLSSTVGYIGKITSENEAAYAEQGYDISSDIVGRDGLELQLEEYLRPTSGSRTVTVDSMGRAATVLEEQPAQNGEDVLLSIDLELQKVAEQSLSENMRKIREGGFGEAFPAAHVGAAVAIDISSGEVLAMASQPGYDPNIFTQPISAEVWKQLNPSYLTEGGQTDADPTLPRPLVNNAVSGAFPPGSTYKAVTAVAGLMEKVITVDEQIEDRGRYTRFSEQQAPACWTWNDSHTTHGNVDMHKALSGSCNYYFYEVGYRVGTRRLEEYARLLGLGEKTGIELPNEARGMVGGETAVQNVLKQRAADMVLRCAPEAEAAAIRASVDLLVDDFSMKNTRELLARYGLNTAQLTSVYNYINDNRWRESRIVSAAVGQGDNNYSVLQMANMAAAIAGGGERYRPRLVKGIPGLEQYTQPQQLSEAFMDAATQASVQSGMAAVVNERGGTAYKHFAGCSVNVAGKTGSAQFEGRDAYAWFIAFAPIENPSIAVAVMVGQGGHGSYVAPVARDIIEAYFQTGSGTGIIQAGDMF